MTLIYKLINQNNVIRICLNKSYFQGSVRQNCQGVLPIKFLYKKVATMFIFKNVVKGEKNKFYDGKEECRL